MGKESDKQREDEPNQRDEEPSPRTGGGGSKLMSTLKLVAASAVLLQAVSTYHGATAERASGIPEDVSSAEQQQQQEHRRRLQSSGGSPSYMEPLFDELKERRKLMEETPPEEVKYWFEYTGPLQVRFPRFMFICELFGFVYNFIFDSRTACLC
mmetsp:Transcript_23010/g.47877  ORF Transcript_23010/g.47877 Transcript_23010/m.47877 type:complete len:154 (+) Transcript_23010:140-601(+)